MPAGTADGRGVTHLIGFDRLTGKPFDFSVAQNGRVEGAFGDMYITFMVTEGA